MRYIDGNVVSQASRQHISNLMSATAARLVEKAEDIDSESEEDVTDQRKGHAGSMSVVRKTLQGIASHDTEEGRVSFGRHDACIQMGRELWSTQELTPEQRAQTHEVFFADGSFPEAKEALEAASASTKLENQRPAPFAERTQPYAGLSVEGYGERINTWFETIGAEEEPPTHEQMRALRRVAQRILQEFGE
jgi:hypothetical protein